MIKGGLPHVRIIDVMIVEDEKLFFRTARGKEFYSELTENRYVLEAFCVEEGEVEFFDLGKEPIIRAYFTLGKKTEIKKGYEITDSCIGCGKCKRGCPQQCIIEETPYKIEQNHCLHCGRCFENCPVQAIRKRG